VCCCSTFIGGLVLHYSGPSTGRHCGGLAICIAAASASYWLPSAMHACGVFLSAQREKERETLPSAVVIFYMQKTTPRHVVAIFLASLQSYICDYWIMRCFSALENK